MKRIATRLKKDSMITMGSWPEERCTETPQRIQGLVSVKRRKRRVINISRKFHADLSNGIIKFFSRKKTGSTDPEFQIDLAKATVMYDDKRIVIILKVANEIHSLIPLEDSLEQWRDAIYKHRLYRQEAVRKGLQPDSTHTLETISGGAGQGFKWVLILQVPTKIIGNPFSVQSSILGLVIGRILPYVSNSLLFYSRSFRMETETEKKT
ncbi:unnamed protein product [Nippostrongylus brasiliensis]|uniref:PHM7_ext domain-containing protein n=1 Tax=Nippostrongylus brasiliensis TaxID=27835 RepID=A0A0N4Y6N9_NIPBR|nr:unnamed protein product [Nippostrongylus brasiliensis]